MVVIFCAIIFFTCLIRQAPIILSRSSFSPWLPEPHTVTRNTAHNFSLYDATSVWEVQTMDIT
jgi:hypothetical protein